jgi:hypothetical protein
MLGQFQTKSQEALGGLAFGTRTAMLQVYFYTLLWWRGHVQGGTLTVRDRGPAILVFWMNPTF